MTVHRMIQRGQYKIVASAQIQEKPTRNSQPPYTSEEICETAMQIIAHDIMETDDPGNYKVSFIGMGGRGRKIVSKHIRMREEQSPRAVNTMDEGDLLVQVYLEIPTKLDKEEEELLRKLAELEHTHVTPHRKSFFKKLKDYFVSEEENSKETKT